MFFCTFFHKRHCIRIRKAYGYPFLILCCIAASVWYYYYGRTVKVNDSIVADEYMDDLTSLIPRKGERDFSRMDNRGPGLREYIVPNIVHYIRFNSPNLTFNDMVCIKSAYYHLKPDYIYFHINIPDLGGYYWNELKKVPDLYRRIRKLQIRLPYTIFGKPFSRSFHYWHASDVMRIKTLMKYGGIYLDNDVYVVKDLHHYRRFEMVLGWEFTYLGTQVLIAHRDSRFLRKWLECYKDYKGYKWMYNASEKPSYEVIANMPELVHVVHEKFASRWSELVYELYQSNWTEWRNQETIHLNINQRIDVQNFYRFRSFNEDNIKEFPYTYRDMALLVYNRTDNGTSAEISTQSAPS